MRVEKLARLVICCLCLAAALFSQIGSVAALVGGLFLLRLFGQGMTTHTYTTAMARRYVAARGRALSLAQLGINIAESIGPASVVALMAALLAALLGALLVMLLATMSAALSALLLAAWWTILLETRLVALLKA